jgi:hypothetical protein
MIGNLTPQPAGCAALLVVLAAALLMMVFSLWWQRKALGRQKEAMKNHERALSQVDESLGLSRRAVELQEETNALLRELLNRRQ